MTSLGRTFDFLQSPDPKNRWGRAKTGSLAIVQGAPVTAPGAPDAFDDRYTAALAAEGAAPVVGKSGLLVWEAPFTAYHGHDPVSTGPSDIDTAPAHTPAQVVHGTEVKFVLRNIDAGVFLGQAAFPGRNMVKPADAKILVADNLLTAGAGDGTTGGFFKKTTDPTVAWARVLKAAFNATTGFGYCECQLLIP